MPAGYLVLGRRRNTSQQAYASKHIVICQPAGDQFISIAASVLAAGRPREKVRGGAVGCLVVILALAGLIASHFVSADEIDGVTTAWTAPVSGQVGSRPVVRSRSVYLADTVGDLYAAAGAHQWKFAGARRVWAPPRRPLCPASRCTSPAGARPRRGHGH